MSATIYAAPRRLIRIFALLGALLIAVALVAPTPTSAAAGCQCTQYVYAAKGMTGSFGDAQTWDDPGGALPNNGFHQSATPQAGDVVVYDGSRPGIDPAGHVGIIQSVTSSSLSVRGANQTPQGTETEAGCTNVNTITFVRRTTGETYWRR
jgi:surface antigen